MEIVALIVLISCTIVGFAAIFFTTFGTLIILIGVLLYAVLTNFSILTPGTLVILLLLYFFGETSEYISVIVAAKKFGASNRAVVGALAGGVLGALIGIHFLGVGLIIGTFLGIFCGAFIVELFRHRDFIKSFKAGAGGVLGRAGSIIVKVVVALVMCGVILHRLISAHNF